MFNEGSCGQWCLYVPNRLIMGYDFETSTGCNERENIINTEMEVNGTLRQIENIFEK